MYTHLNRGGVLGGYRMMGHRVHARRACSGTKRFKFFAPARRDVFVPANHVYHQREAKLNLSFVRDLVRDCYEELGRRSINPVVLFKIQRSALRGNLRLSMSREGAEAKTVSVSLTGRPWPGCDNRSAPESR